MTGQVRYLFDGNSKNWYSHPISAPPQLYHKRRGHWVMTQHSHSPEPMLRRICKTAVVTPRSQHPAWAF